MTICAATTLRAPVEMTRLFVVYHLNLGLDHLYVFLDDPDDPAAEHLAGLPRVTVTRCDDGHWSRVGLADGRAAPVEDRQLANTNTALTWARRDGHEWMVHLDGDELIHAAVPLQRLVDETPDRFDVVLMPLREAVPSRLDHAEPFREITDFKAAGFKRNVWKRYRIRDPHKPQWTKYQRRLRLARRLGSRTIRGAEFYRGAYMPRALIRVSDRVEQLLVKGPLMSDAERPRAVFTDQAELLHFDAYSYDLWRLKWERRLDGTATAARLRGPRLELKAAFDAAYAAGDEPRLRDLFRQWHMVSRWERIVLRSLGLLRRVRLDPKLFAAIR